MLVPTFVTGYPTMSPRLTNLGRSGFHKDQWPFCKYFDIDVLAHLAPQNGQQHVILENTEVLFLMKDCRHLACAYSDKADQPLSYRH